MSTYEVEFSYRNHYETEKVEADDIRESSDGEWLIFADGVGEVRRFKTKAVYEVKRIEP